MYSLITEVFLMRINKILIVVALLTTILVPTCFAQHVSLAYEDGALNLRRGPGRKFDSVGIVEDGDHIVVEEYGSVWSRVRTDFDEVGYIKNLYIDDGDTDFAAGTTYVSSYKAYLTADATFRSGASSDTDSMGTLKKGTRVTVLGKNGRYYLVKKSNGSQGYVRSKYISRNKPGGSSSKRSSDSGVVTKYVTAKSVNMREEGSILSDVIRTLPYGAEVTVLKSGTYWDKVSYKGYVGWIKKCYLKR